jgi:hypothetical protein
MLKGSVTVGPGSPITNSEYMLSLRRVLGPVARRLRAAYLSQLA